MENNSIEALSESELNQLLKEFYERQRREKKLREKLISLLSTNLTAGIHTTPKDLRYIYI